MTPHQPYVVIRADAAGRHRARCETCIDGSEPSFHKPVAEAWRKAHNAEATRRPSKEKP